MGSEHPQCAPLGCCSAAKSTIHIGPTLSENAWAGGFKGDSRTKGPVYDEVLILDNQLAVITQNTAGFKEKPFNKVASEIAGCQLFGSCYFLLVGRKPVKKGMHELYYFTERLFMNFVSLHDHAMQLKAIVVEDDVEFIDAIAESLNHEDAQVDGHHDEEKVHANN